MSAKYFLRDQRGAVMVEVTIMLSITLILVFGAIDFLVHSLAFANKDYLAVGKFISTPRDVYRQAIDISAYSLLALTRGVAPLMSNGGSILAMSCSAWGRSVRGNSAPDRKKIGSTRKFMTS